MAANSIFYTIGLDATKHTTGSKQVIANTKDMGKAMQEAFGTKLKQIISFTAIEEATRRTAEWAAEITQTSKALGITAEQLQTLNVIASKTGTAQSAAVDMFTSIKTAAEAALGGNVEMIASFQKLGVTIDRTKTAGDIFGDVMGKIGDIKGGLVNNQDNFLRQSVTKITGQPEQVAANMAAGFNGTPGTGLKGKGDNLLGENSIASNADIQEISALWAQIKTELAESGKELLPLAAGLLSIAEVFVQAIAGLSEGIRGIVKMFTGHFNDGVKTLFDLLLSTVVGAQNVVTNLIGLIPGLGGYAARLSQRREAGLAAEGVSPETAARGEAIGNVAAMAVSLPEGFFVKAAGAVAGKAVKIAEAVPAIGKVFPKAVEKLANVEKWSAKKLADTREGRAAALGSAAEKLEKKGMSRIGSIQTNIVRRVLPNSPTMKAVTQIEAQLSADLSYMDVKRSGKRFFHRSSGLPVTDAETLKHAQKLTKMAGLEVSKVWVKAYSGVSNKLYKWVRLGQLLSAGAIGAMVASSGIQAVKQTSRNITPGKGSKLLPTINPFITALASGGGNLKIGGMFGAGETRIIRMTQKMIDLLGQIATNTRPWIGNPQHMSATGGEHPAVGAAGGR